jgi:tetratricopeptide (TPR) repeat protein
LRARRAGNLFLAKYWGAEEAGQPNDFTQVMRAAGTDRDGEETWYYFPVYEFAYRTILEGVAFAGEDADDFLGLYRVDDQAQPLLLPCVTLNGSGDPGRLTAGIRIPHDPLRFFTPENEQVQISESSEMAEKLDRGNDAVFYACVGYALNPSNERRIRVASAREKAGQIQESLRLLESAVLSSGEDFVSSTALEEFLKRNTSVVAAPPVWRELAEQTSSVRMWRAYAQSLDEKDAEGRIYAHRQLLRIKPGELDSATKLQGLLDDKAARLEATGDLPGAVSVYREAIPLNPRNNQPVLLLGTTLSKSSPAECRNVWEAIWKDNSGNSLVAALCGAARAATGDLAGAKEAFAASRCVLAADAFAAAGAWNDAAEDYGRALALNPKLDYLRGRLEDSKRRATALSIPPETAPRPSAP